MVEAATKCGRFVVPLPRALSGLGEEGYEMFFMQWLFHPTEGVSSLDSTADGDAHSPLPITSVLFTPLAEFRKNGEWSQPHLVLTHYPDLYNIPPSSSTVTSSTSSSKSIPNGQHHPIILLRGEILSSPNSSALSSPLPSSNLSLTQSQAQLLAMALQRFYCSSIPAPVESEKDKEERLGRKEALEMFARGDERFDWEGLVQMAYGGVV
jgi:ATP synthase mitochondrial F1 complex assembly factor 1